MTWWLEYWTITPDVLFTFKGNLEIPTIQTSYVKKESNSGIMLWGPTSL